MESPSSLTSVLEARWLGLAWVISARYGVVLVVVVPNWQLLNKYQSSYNYETSNASTLTVESRLVFLPGSASLNAHISCPPLSAQQGACALAPSVKIIHPVLEFKTLSQTPPLDAILLGQPMFCRPMRRVSGVSDEVVYDKW